MADQRIIQEPKRFQIRIESILGGHSPTTHFSRPDQFRGSSGINPALGVSDSQSSTSVFASGLIRPAFSKLRSSSTLTSKAIYMLPNPKDGNIYVLDSAASVYTFDFTGTTLTALSDAGTMTSAGRGAAYYDNYMYFANNTAITRYGPLNGSPGFVGDYWTGTLAKPALNNVSYGNVNDGDTATALPNHHMHRHSDGRLYICDVSTDNLGMLHYIATTKTTVEGDTDAGSQYQALTFGYGLYPICLETYGQYLAIALIEMNSGAFSRNKAKIAFWDTTSQNFNNITWVEFPDEKITALKNINGVLYVFSCAIGAASGSAGGGYRITRFVGGFSFEEVFFSEDGYSPPQGAVDGGSAQLVYGSYSLVPESGPRVMSLGLQKKSVSSNGLFSILRGTYVGKAIVTALTKGVDIAGAYGLGNMSPFFAWSNGSAGGTNNGIDTYSAGGSNTSIPIWWSQIYKIGSNFRITKITIPLPTGVDSNATVTPTIYVDDDATSAKILTAINATNYAAGKKLIVIKPENLTGKYNFWLEFRWTTSQTGFCPIGLPISIEYELVDTQEN
jgi:hypothetical protein